MNVVRDPYETIVMIKNLITGTSGVTNTLTVGANIKGTHCDWNFDEIDCFFYQIYRTNEIAGKTCFRVIGKKNVF